MKTINRRIIIGWVATLLSMGGILWMLKQNNKLNEFLQVTMAKNIILKEERATIESQLAESNKILGVLRSKDYQVYTIPGNQAVAPEAFAKVYLNKKEKIAYIDAKSLPVPPRGKGYQVWSFKMESLIPTNIGLIDEQNEVIDGIYKLVNFPDFEALGITLEPEGGSKTPTLSQLYILGKIAI